MLLARRRFGAVNGKTTAEEEEEEATATAEEDRQTDSKKYPVIISLRMGKGKTRQKCREIYACNDVWQAKRNLIAINKAGVLFL